MKNNSFLKTAFALLLALFVTCAQAQHLVRVDNSVKSYKKNSCDTVRLRNNSGKSVKISSKAKNDVVKKQDKVSSAKESKIDSLEYSLKSYRLGERVIMPGDSGSDVRSVAKILVNKIYIDEESLIYTSDSGVLYQGELVKAVMRFQEFNGFHVDGIIGHDLIKALRKRK